MAIRLTTRAANELRTDYSKFALAVHPDWEKTYFQSELLAPHLELLAINDLQWKRLIFTLPFRYSKTEFCVETFVPFYFGQHPDHPVILMSYAKTIARKSGRAIREIMKSDLYVELFPHARLATYSRAQDEFETVSKGKFYAGGFDTGVNGRGAKLLIIDDPHKNQKDISSEVIMDDQRELYKQVVTRRCEPNAAIVIGSVRWAPNDLIGWRIEEDGAWDVVRDKVYQDDEGTPVTTEVTKNSWKVVRLQAECLVDEGWRKASCKCGLKDTRGNVVEHGEPLWPGHWTCEDNYKNKLEDATVYESSYLLQPKVQGGYILASTPPNYYKTQNPQGMNIYLLCDPSMGRGKKSDRTSIGIIGTGEDQNYYLLDLISERMDMISRVDNIFRLHRKWKPIGVGYEEYGMLADSSHIKDRMERENYRFTITELGRKGEWHNLNKPDRIKTLLPLATAGRIWLPDPESHQISPLLSETIKKFVTRQWNKYPACTYDDDLDMFSRINDPAMGIKFPITNFTPPSTVPRPAGASWMSM